ncbi:MAG TPA: DUF6597 domain-containing transcriptional factor, partial [Candidatus Polarisedimenticolia bacterium]|nr:DUF6597 domain-containing transcriptional factor [Candidatus Polarisedimenticolia bacterium]
MHRYHEYEPHEILRDTVKCFWIHEAEYSFETDQDIAPDGCVELIFNFGDPYRLRKKPRPITLPPAIIVGFQDKTIPLLLRGKLKVVAARLYAWGALALVQDNVTTLANSVTPLKGWDALMERLRSAVLEGKFEQAVAVLEEHLVRQSLARTFDRRTIQAAAKLLHHTRGQVRIAELADYCHMSVRQLERGFRQGVGASPTSFARTL